MTPQFMEQGHLGGYLIGGDPATYYPHLWKWLVEDHGISSVIDVGCGEGHAIDFFESLGIWNLGIDGVYQDHPRIWQHDYTLGGLSTMPAPYAGVIAGMKTYQADLIWCCEFVEHIEERYVPNFLETFKCVPLVLMTHAGPGQFGYHHVNCRDSEYWIGAMAAIGYAYDPVLTVTTRTLARINNDPHNHYARSGLAFARS